MPLTSAAHQKRLLAVLSSHLMKLPRTFWLLVAARDEPGTYAALARPGVVTRDVRINDKLTASDISQLFPRF